MTMKEAIAKKFESNGYPEGITGEDREVLGLPGPYNVKCGWYTLTHMVYKHFTGEEMTPSPFIGKGSTSRYYGEQAAKAIRESANLTK